MDKDSRKISDSRQLLEPFHQACLTSGLKVTHQREQIYLYLAASSSHPTAETIYNSLKSSLPSLSLDTVYRTLSTLEQHHLIKRLQTVHAQARYEANMTDHHHFICLVCDKVIDFHWPDFAQSPLPADLSRIGSILGRTVSVSGICKACQSHGHRADLLSHR